MAPIAMIFGGITGTISAVFGWLLFGLSLWGAVQVYFLVALTVSAALIAIALLQPKRRSRTEPAGLQRA